MQLFVFSPFSPVLRRSVWLFLAGLSCLAVVGCEKATEPDANTDKSQSKLYPMRVIVVDDAPFATVLERQWKARIESSLELQQMSSEQLETVRQLVADVIIYPSACLGTLAHRKLIAAPSEAVFADQQYSLRDVFELQRGAEVRWGEQSYAFTFGSPQLVLAYRADLLRDRQLQPPLTWEQYQQLAERLTRSELGDSGPAESVPWSAVCEPLRAPWAAQVLLARAASYASHPSQFSVFFDYLTMEPLIAGPPFVRALEELVTAAKLGVAAPDQMTPEAARRTIMAGRAAMALCWPSHSTSDGQPLELAEGVEIGFTQLPGAIEAYNFGEQTWTPHEEQRTVYVPLLAVAGKLGSVVSNARRPRESAGILALLTGREWSGLLSPESPSTTLFRQSQVNAPQVWTDEALTLESSRQYTELVATTQSQPRRLSSIRIPGWQRYMAVLDQAVHAAHTGTQTPQQALTETAEAWSAITEELGLDSQREAYTRSLGLEP